MVNFNNETTVTTPAGDVVKILLLQRRADLFEAIEKYHKEIYQGVSSTLSIIRARLFSLFLEMQGALNRKLKELDYLTHLDTIKNSTDFNSLLDETYFLNVQLDNMGLTKIDTRKQYDNTNVETENKVKGL